MAEKAAETQKQKKQDPHDADKAIAEEVELLLTRIEDGDIAVRSAALTQLRTKLRQGKGSVTSLPKPLKYLRAKVDRLVAVHATLVCDTQRESEALLKSLADLISFVMTMYAAGDAKLEALGSSLYWKQSGNINELEIWGHEYVRHLTAEVIEAFQSKAESFEALTHAILEFEFSHNGEIHATDFLLELNQLDRLEPFMNESNFDAIGKYLKAVADYLPKGEDMKLLAFIGNAYYRFGFLVDAVRFWLRVGVIQKVQGLLLSSEVHHAQRLQIAHIVAVHGGVLTPDFAQKLEAAEPEVSGTQMVVDGESPQASVLRVLRNIDRERYLEHLSSKLDSAGAKKPADILKTSFDATPSLFSFSDDKNKSTDWTKLAKCVVDCLANAGSGEGGSIEQSLQKITNKGHQVTAIASQGFLHMWKQEKALNALEVHASSSDEGVRAGAAFAMGAVFAGCPCAEYDPAFSLLSEHIPRNVMRGESLEENDKMLRITSIVGLGIAHAGTLDTRLADELLPLLVDGEEDTDIKSFAALALGFVFLGSMHQDTIEALTIALMDKSDGDLEVHPSLVYMILGLALLFLGHREEADTMILTTKTFPRAIQSFAENAIVSLAYAGTGNVMQIQRFLAHLMKQSAGQGEVKENEEPEGTTSMMEVDDSVAEAEATDAAINESSEKAMIDKILASATGGAAAGAPEPLPKATEPASPMYPDRALAVLGIGLITMAEDIGNDMCKRMMDHVLQFGGPEARRGIPLALAFMSISDPGVAVLESLAKLSHDSDTITAQNAIIGIGFAAAGTNNSRAITLLRNLNSYYAKNDKFLFLSHFAMGLVSLGKGMLTLSPLHSERFLLSNASLAGLLVVAFSMMNPSKTIFDSFHFMVLTLITAARPRALLTVDTALNPHDVTVRVGSAVDTVAAVGKKKRLTGFQTHGTPALLSARDNAEIPVGVNDPEIDALTPVIEGVVLVEKRSAE